MVVAGRCGRVCGWQGCMWGRLETVQELRAVMATRPTASGSIWSASTKPRQSQNLIRFSLRGKCACMRHPYFCVFLAVPLLYLSNMVTCILSLLLLLSGASGRSSCRRDAKKKEVGVWGGVVCMTAAGWRRHLNGRQWWLFIYCIIVYSNKGAICTTIQQSRAPPGWSSGVWATEDLNNKKCLESSYEVYIYILKIETKTSRAFHIQKTI